MNRFTYEVQPTRVVFGAGSISSLGDEIGRLGCTRALVLTTPEQRGIGERVLSDIGDLGCGVFSKARMHTPTDVTENALSVARSLRADCVVSIGGGSTIGLGKALAVRTELKHLAISTTYAGSEMTPILGETEVGVKKTIRSAKILPNTAIYDVGLTMSLPVPLSIVSGINAIAHAAEALYAKDANPIISLMAEEGIRSLTRSLPAIASAPRDIDARTAAQYGAWLCGACLGAVGMALHHKVCHVLGGTFDLPHAETHTVILPHALGYNASAAPEAMSRIARAINADDPAVGVYRMAKQLGAAVSLRDLGMPEAGIEKATSLIMKDSYWNPRPIEIFAISEMLRRAWHGELPSSH